MTRLQPSPGRLTSLDSALGALLGDLAPVAPTWLRLDQALGFVAAGDQPLEKAHPARDTAETDGWAVHALDLAGASAYAPVPLSPAPQWVEAGEAMPEGCDCVLEDDLLAWHGPIAMACGEAVSGSGVRRAGQDLAAAGHATLAGKRLGAIDLLVARSAGLDRLALRIPRLRVIDIAHEDRPSVTAQFVLEHVRAAGAACEGVEPSARDGAAVARALARMACDMIVVVGGTGAGRRDATAEALLSLNALRAHQIALQPGRSTGVGRLDQMPVIALPGAPDQAFAGCQTLVLPVLDRLSGHGPRESLERPLARKISSTIGFVEMALVKRRGEEWLPLAVGAFSLDQMRSADAWLAVDADSEGYGEGTPVSAFPLCHGLEER